ncbi:MAG: hypothetical protein E7214_10845 [Clostridium sp.]|nr:hypothetical protein [Clostridium sp.]
MLFIVVAMIFGIFIKYKKPNQLTEAIIGVVLFIAMVAVGIYCPLYYDKNIWTIVVFGYLFLASILPMWLLMQPRDYLTTFLLISMVIGAVLGVLVANPSMNLNAFNGFLGKIGMPEYVAICFMTMCVSALVLITIAVFLKTTGRKSFMLYIPMFVMLLVTFTVLVQAVVNIFKKIFVTGNFVFLTDGLQLIFAILLMSLGIMVAKSNLKK